MTSDVRKVLIPSGRDSDIPALYNYAEKVSGVVLLCHGFASDKNNNTGSALRERLAREDIALMSFDLPAHGDRWDDKDLTVENCLSDIASCEKYAKTVFPGAPVYYFGSSFGGYLMLLYLAGKTPKGGRAFLRSAAVTMPELFEEDVRRGKPVIDENGCFYIEFDYRQPMYISKDFIDSLNNNKLDRFYPCEGCDLFFVQGTEDEEVPYGTVADFASRYGFKIYTFQGGDHRLSRPGMPEKVTELAASFFTE